MRLPTLPSAAILKKFPSKFYTVLAGVLIICGLTVGVYAHQSSDDGSHSGATVEKPSSSGDTNQATSSDSEPSTTTESPAQSAVHTTSTSASTTAPTGTSNTAKTGDFDFSLSTTSVTVVAGAKSQPIRASTSDGRPIYWAALAGNGLFSDPLTADNAASYTFALNSSPGIVKPGTYTITVKGYIPRGKSVDKTITVTVLPGIMFNVIPLAPNRAEDTATQFFIPFQIQPVAGVTLTNLTMSATVISHSGSGSIGMQGVWDDGGSYYKNKKVAIFDYGTATGHLVVRVTVSASGYTTSLDISYDIQ